MAVFGSGSVTGLEIIDRAQAVAAQWQATIAMSEDFRNWLVGQVDADLNADGVVETDVTAMRSMAADTHDLVLKYNGGTGDGNHPSPYNYSASVNVVAGPG